MAPSPRRCKLADASSGIKVERASPHRPMPKPDVIDEARARILGCILSFLFSGIKAGRQ